MHTKVKALLLCFTPVFMIGCCITVLQYTPMPTINPTQRENNKSDERQTNLNGTYETDGKSPISKAIVKENCQLNDEMFVRLMDAIQFERKSTLLNACTKSNPGFPGITDGPILNALYSSKYKCAVCVIFKCGYTSWLEAVLVMEGYYSMEQYFNKEMHSYKARKLGETQASFGFNKDIQTAKALWNDETFSIITVREPLSRLVSAYHDKLTVVSPDFNNIYEGISRRVNKEFRHLRHRPEERNVTGDGTATFEDFLNFLILSKSSDLHWAFFDSKCQPCHVKYDYIVKFDTLNDDIRYLKQRLNISDFDSQAFFPKSHYKTDYAKVERQFKDIPKELALKLFEKYRRDYELFGFSKPSWL